MGFHHNGDGNVGSLQYHTRHLITWSPNTSKVQDWQLEFFQLLRNLAGDSAALLLSHLANFKAISSFWLSISWVQGLTRSYDVTSHRIFKQIPHPPTNPSPLHTTPSHPLNIHPHQAQLAHPHTSLIYCSIFYKYLVMVWESSWRGSQIESQNDMH